MITKNHPTAYSDLFKKAQEVLNKYGNTNSDGNKVTEAVTISNIDEYFGVLKALAEIEQRAENGDINEYIDPIFTILPATEETFNIDANSRKISVPDNFAKYGAGVQGDEIAEILYFSIDRYFDAMDLATMDILIQWKHSADNDALETLSATYKKSLTLQPGKIVFGWPITKEMTDQSGNIQFSVRFYRRENQTLIYSFSTLPAQVKIQSGLDFKLNDESIRMAINKNTAIYNNLKNSVPVNVNYVVAAPTFEARWIQAQNSNELIPATQATYDLPITFAAKAKFADNDEGQISGNGISYSWYKEGDSTPIESMHGYKIARQGEYNNDKEIYYILNNGVYEPYYSDGNPFDDEDVGDIYVRYGKFTPSIAGSYYVKATNAYTHNSSTSANSEKWVIPGPSDPSFTYNGTNRELVIEQEPTIKIEATLVDGDTIEDDKWYKSEDNILKIDVDTLLANDGDTYDATDEGYYFRVMQIARNGVNKTITSQPIWTRHQASTPAIIGTSGNHATTVSITVAKPQYGNVSYQWKTIDGNNVESNGTSSSYTGPVGMYVCCVTNSYKGTTSSVTSAVLAITG